MNLTHKPVSPLAALFGSAITQLTDELTAEISASARQNREQRIGEARQTIEADKARTFAEVAGRLAAGIATEHQSEVTALQRRLHDERERLVDELFETAAQRLRTFTATAEYKEFLAGIVQQRLREYNADKAEIGLRDEDIALFEPYVAELPCPCQLVSLSHDVIGGVIISIPTRSILIDESFAGLLAEQRRWFIHNCGLIL